MRLLCAASLSSATADAPIIPAFLRRAARVLCVGTLSAKVAFAAARVPPDHFLAREGCCLQGEDRMRTVRAEKTQALSKLEEIGYTVEHFKLQRVLGKGGMGTVYEAMHVQLGKRYALKILHEHLMHNSQAMGRFLAEGKNASRTPVEGVVAIHHQGLTRTGVPYIVMDYLDGETLSDYRAQLFRPRGTATPNGKLWGRTTEPIPDGSVILSVLRIARQLACTLHRIHESGIVHRDLKPDNLLVVRDPDVVGGNRIKLLDFGIARIVSSPQNPQPIDQKMNTEIRTLPGCAVGTPAYMPPEQWIPSGEPRPSLDVYACGVIFYEFMCGKNPFTATGVSEYRAQHLQSVPKSLIEVAAWIPSKFSELVQQMLTKSPQARPTMSRVAEVLDEIIREYLIPHRRGVQTMLDAAVSTLGTPLPQKRKPPSRRSTLLPVLPQHLTGILTWQPRQAGRQALIVLSGLVGLLAIGLVVTRWFQPDRDTTASAATPATGSLPSLASSAALWVRTSPPGADVFVVHPQDEHIDSLRIPRCTSPCLVARHDLAQAGTLVILRLPKHHSERLTVKQLQASQAHVTFKPIPIRNSPSRGTPWTTALPVTRIPQAAAAAALPPSPASPPPRPTANLRGPFPGSSSTSSF